MGFYSVVTYLSQSVNTNTDVYYRERARMFKTLPGSHVSVWHLCGRKTSHHQFYIIGCVFHGELLAPNFTFADTVEREPSSDSPLLPSTQ